MKTHSSPFRTILLLCYVAILVAEHPAHAMHVSASVMSNGLSIHGCFRFSSGDDFVQGRGQAAETFPLFGKTAVLTVFPAGFAESKTASVAVELKIRALNDLDLIDMHSMLLSHQAGSQKKTVILEPSESKAVGDDYVVRWKDILPTRALPEDLMEFLFMIQLHPVGNILQTDDLPETSAEDNVPPSNAYIAYEWKIFKSSIWQKHFACGSLSSRRVGKGAKISLSGYSVSAKKEEKALECVLDHDGSSFSGSALPYVNASLFVLGDENRFQESKLGQTSLMSILHFPAHETIIKNLDYRTVFLRALPGPYAVLKLKLLESYLTVRHEPNVSMFCENSRVMDITRPAIAAASMENEYIYMRLLGFDLEPDHADTQHGCRQIVSEPFTVHGVDYEIVIYPDGRGEIVGQAVLGIRAKSAGHEVSTVAAGWGGLKGFLISNPCMLDSLENATVRDKPLFVAFKPNDTTAEGNCLLYIPWMSCSNLKKVYDNSWRIRIISHPVVTVYAEQTQPLNPFLPTLGNPVQVVAKDENTVRFTVEVGRHDLSIPFQSDQDMDPVSYNTDQETNADQIKLALYTDLCGQVQLVINEAPESWSECRIYCWQKIDSAKVGWVSCSKTGKVKKGVVRLKLGKLGELLTSAVGDKLRLRVDAFKKSSS